MKTVPKGFVVSSETPLPFCREPAGCLVIEISSVATTAMHGSASERLEGRVGMWGRVVVEGRMSGVYF